MATTTTSYGLKKPAGTENYDVEDQNGNMDLIDEALAPSATADTVPSTPAVNNSAKLSIWLSWILNRIKVITGKANWWDAPSKTLEDVETHLADDTKHIDYAVANGTDTYTATISNITELTEGMSIKIKFTNSNTGTSTLNINNLGAIAIKKGTGNDLASGNIKAGQIAHLVYTGSVFQLLGEGGEYGTALPNDVRNTTTLGTENGVVQGTLDLTNLIPANLKKDVNAGGIIGTLEPIQIVAGDIAIYTDGIVRETMFTEYTKLKEVVINKTGSYRVKYTSKVGSGGSGSLYTGVYITC